MSGKIIAFIISSMAISTVFADHNLVIKSTNVEVSVYCAPYEVGVDYQGELFLTVPAGNKTAEKSLDDLFKSSQGASVGCNVFYKNTLLGNFGFVLEKSGLLSVGSAGFLTDTDYHPMVGKSAPDVYITSTFAPSTH